MKVKKILILTSNYGQGHIKAADNLFIQIKQTNPSVDVKIVNLFDEAHPYINNIVKKAYLKCHSILPKLYSTLYYKTRHPKNSSIPNFLNKYMGEKKLLEYLDEFKPDIVINTYFFVSMPDLYKKRLTKIPCYAVITDYGIHGQWIHDGIKKYFVGHQRVKNEMVNFGVDSDKIVVTGIPIYLKNNYNFDRDKIFEKYNIENNKLPIITILCGANSIMRNVHKMCAMLYLIKPEGQYIVVCGKNEKLKQKLEKHVAKYSNRIKIFGFINELPEIMAISDVLITKPGGITITEALNIGTPLILYGITAGQENENAKLLLENECCYISKNINELDLTLTHLMKNPELIEKMRQNSKKLSTPTSCADIVNYILNEL